MAFKNFIQRENTTGIYQLWLFCILFSNRLLQNILKSKFSAIRERFEHQVYLTYFSPKISSLKKAANLSLRKLPAWITTLQKKPRKITTKKPQIQTTPKITKQKKIEKV